MTTQLRQDIENFCKQFLDENMHVNDVAIRMQELTRRVWNEAVQDVPPSLKIT
jgi:ribosomal protein L31E